MLGAAGVILTENERKISEFTNSVFRPESQNFFDITHLNIIDCKAIMSIARAQCKHEPIWAWSRFCVQYGLLEAFHYYPSVLYISKPGLS